MLFLIGLLARVPSAVSVLLTVPGSHITTFELPLDALRLCGPRSGRETPHRQRRGWRIFAPNPVVAEAAALRHRLARPQCRRTNGENALVCLTTRDGAV